MKSLLSSGKFGTHVLVRILYDDMNHDNPNWGGPFRWSYPSRPPSKPANQNTCPCFAKPLSRKWNAFRFDLAVRCLHETPLVHPHFLFGPSADWRESMGVEL